jgi:outer membrane protein assembly factor BamB
MSNGSFDADGPAKPSRRPAWILKLPGRRVRMAYDITSEPVLVEGRLVVGLLDERIAALDPQTGVEAWSAAAVQPGAPDPVVHRGAVFAALDWRPPSIVSMDLTTGARRWKTALEPGPPFGVLRPVAVAGDQVLVVNGANVLALAADSGEVKWRVVVTPVYSPMGIAAEGEAVVVSMSDGSPERRHFTVGLDAATGAERWRFPGEGRMSPAISGGEVFCAGPGDTLAVLDAASGALRWCGPAALHPWSRPAITPDLVFVAHRYLGSGPWAPGAILALDRATGVPRWMHDMPADAYDPHVAAGRSAVYATGKTLRALDRGTGELLWEWSPPARTRLERRPTVGEGMIFVPTDRGLFAVGGRT